MFCDLIVWTLEDLAIIPIAKDANWAINIEKLTNFYFTVHASSISEIETIQWHILQYFLVSYFC